MKPYFVHNCKDSFVWRKYIRTLWLPDRQPIKVLKPLNDRQLEISVKKKTKQNKLKEPTQSKLSYVDEEPQCDPKVIYKSHV